MSKCQINKYKAGGRCGGSENSAANGYTSAEYSAYLTKRGELDRLLSGTPQTGTVQPSQAIIKTAAPTSDRKKDIDMILNGDFE
jgi:hypothetical protein